MGAYLNTPVREKDSDDRESCSLRYGASSMQGWRISQEDAHNCCPDFDADKEAALFAVYDGHGGAEVAQYTAEHFPKFLLKSAAYKEGHFAHALEEAFLEFDKLLTTEEVIEKLKELAGIEYQPPHNDSADEEEERGLLIEESDMPIEKLLERYGQSKPPNPNEVNAWKKKKKDIQSPSIRPKQPGLAPNPKAASGDDGSETKNGQTEEILNGLNDSSSPVPPSKQRTEDKCETLPDNGVAEKTVKECAADVVSSSDTKQGSSSSSSSSTSEPNGPCSSSSSSSAAAATPADAATPSSNEAEAGSSSDQGGASSKKEGESDSEDSNYVDDDSDQYESCDSEEDDVEMEGFPPKFARDAGEEEEEDEEEDKPAFMGSGEEPGADSGCTAVVALVHDLNLYVANAGDSRCVLCRDGKAIDMSEDHKPEDPIELSRINKAGGCVTMDGRVNGGLNLSRAIGDHCYKQNTALSLKEQMITSLPDVKCLPLEPTDEFMVLACDGIWNVMSSQDVVSYVREHIQAGTQKLSAICEELFEACLAPDTSGDGTGCDNMTCIIVALDKLPLEALSSEAASKVPCPIKRRADSSGADSEGFDVPEAKKPCLEPADSSNGSKED